jgi:hypothetical protein
MRQLGPKALYRLPGGGTVLSRLLGLVRDRLPASQPVVVAGFEADRVFRALPPGVMGVENELYDDYGVGRSIEVGARVCVRPRLLIVYGDLLFTEAFLADLPPKGSWAFLAERDRAEVGATVVRGRVEAFNFAVPSPKWAQAVVLDGPELVLFRDLLPASRDRLGHEILNLVIDRGGEIRGFSPECLLEEIDDRSDLKRVQENAW